MTVNGEERHVRRVLYFEEIKIVAYEVQLGRVGISETVNDVRRGFGKDVGESVRAKTYWSSPSHKSKYRFLGLILAAKVSAPRAESTPKFEKMNSLSLLNAGVPGADKSIGSWLGLGGRMFLSARVRRLD